MGAFFSLIFGKLGLTLICVTIIAVALAVVARNWSCRQPRPPRPPRPDKWVEYRVVKVINGATIEVTKSDKKDKRTRTLNLEGIRAPADGERLFAESAAHLAVLAGKTVTVQVRGVLHEPMRIVCPRCKGKGKFVLSKEKIIMGYFYMWMAPHVYKCEQCKKAIKEDNMDGLCDKAREVLAMLREKYKDQEPVEQDCDCDGGYDYKVCPGVITNDPNAAGRRTIIVGIAFGEAGACLNLEQIKGGWCWANPGVPKEWKEAEDEAKAAHKGLWQ